MLILETGSESLSNFTRQTSDYLTHLHETGSPLVLTIDGKAEVVVQDTAAYQRLVELADQAEREAFRIAVQEGLDDVDAGRIKPALEVIRELAIKRGFKDPTQ
jgi:predicted transcriptional regulator